MTPKHIPCAPASQSAWPELSACAEPIRTSDRVAQLVRELSLAGMASFAHRLSSVAIDVRAMESECDARVAVQFDVDDELARPGTNLRPFRK